MGVDVNFIVLYGFKIDLETLDKTEEDKILDIMYEDKLDNYCLYDQMSGKYFFVCKIISNMDIYGSSEEICTFDLEESSLLKLSEEIKEKYNSLGISLPDEKFQIYHIAHYH